MSKIIIKNLEKSFGNNKVIDNFNIDIKDQEFIVLVGPSGCGKSTLLRMISGLESIDEGEIFLDGKLINNLIPSKRKIAMVFQSYALYPHMNVFENISFGLKMEKISKDEINKKVNQAANILQIQDLLERKPKQLSGGQKQRVAIGRAITRSPKVFLFDEPLSNLDAELRVTMRKELSALHEKIGGTMIYVTHDQVEAMTLADQIVVLNNGYVAQAGAPLDLYNNPSDIFVAGFIGSPKMNFIKVNAIDKSGSFNLVSDALNLQTNHKNLQNNTPYSLGIRPEHIEVCEQQNSDLKVHVDFTEQLGSETYFYCQGEGIKQLIVHHTGQYKINKGEELYLRFKRDSVHLFEENGMSVSKKNN